MTVPVLGDLLRDLAPQVLGALARRSGDFAAAEDATQEALVAAALRWPADGVPDHPRAWLVRTGHRKLIDGLRGEQARRRREELAARREPPPATPPDHDDTLVVLFMCCHPALTDSAAIALTLRAVGGLTTAEIARAFLVPEATMAQRISRAKQRIRASGVPFALPEPDQRRGRLRAVLRVLYLLYNEGLDRPELSKEAVRLARLLHRDLHRDESGHAEAAGLLALMLLTEARRPARTGPEIVPLAEQDRSRWDRPMIAEGTALVDAAIGRGAIGEYQIQAAIAALHARAPRARDTDWPQILALYGLLERLTNSPVVALNRAVAAAMVHGPAHGLRLTDELAATTLKGHHRLAAVRAHLHELAGDPAAAIEHYRAAAAATTSLPEQRYLTLRAARLRSHTTEEPVS